MENRKNFRKKKLQQGLTMLELLLHYALSADGVG